MSARLLDSALGWGVSIALHVLLLAGAAILLVDDCRWGLEGECYVMVAPELLLIEAAFRPRDAFDRIGSSPEGSVPPVECAGGFDSLTDRGSGPRTGLIYKGPVDALELEPLQSRATEGAVTAALRWLARHQNKDGSWSVDRFGRHCVEGPCGGSGGRDCDDCATSLALFAFLRAGYGDSSRIVAVDPAVAGQELRFHEVVSRGTSWLSARENYGGCLGSRELSARVRSEAFCKPPLFDPSPADQALASTQKTMAEGCENGSWDPGESDHGRVALTAIHALRLKGHPDPEQLLGECKGGYR